MYIYLVSSGAYSSYGLEYLAVHKKKFSLDELKQVIETTKKNYIDRGYPKTNYKVDACKMGEELFRVLDGMGFNIIYPVGELHLLDYSILDDMDASIPWEVKDKPESALRMGLA